LSDFQHITSRDNPLIKELRRLSQEPSAYRKAGRVWVEGDHLCQAARQAGQQPEIAVFSEEIWHQVGDFWTSLAIKKIVLPTALMREISQLESPAQMGCVLPLPQWHALEPGLRTVVLDRVQDPGNVGSILRSAAAFGFRQVAAIKGSAALWSPKVLRAGMGAHFALRLVESLGVEDAAHLPQLAVTSSHGGSYLHELAPEALAQAVWVMGHEGQGVSAELEQRAALRVRIAQPGGEESLNVAAAAAICLHASAVAALKGM
jgi:RNA methyltransferase, TrmH family